MEGIVDVTHKILKAVVEQPTTGTLWTREYAFTPAVLNKVYGDGEALFGLTTCNSRPRYYVIRGDSNWACDMDPYWVERSGPDIGEIIDDILSDTEEQFGSGRWPDEEEEDDYRRPWPALDDENGCMWWRMKWPCGAIEKEAA